MEVVLGVLNEAIRVFKNFCANYLVGPHETRSWVGSLSLRLVQSRTWERIFLAYILFNCMLKLTWRRDIPCSYSDLLNLFALWACVIFTGEWLIELLAFGIKPFFNDGWYKTDTLVNIFNWGSYASRMGYLPPWISVVFPNIAFIRMLRFLKPLGRVQALFASKVVVKTVADAIGSMGPVLSLVGFFVLLFSIVGVNIFGRKGLLLYTCGRPFSFEEASELLQDGSLSQSSCDVNLELYTQFVETLDASPDALRDLTINSTRMACISVTPLMYCKCTPDPEDFDHVPHVCIEENDKCTASSSLCFRGDQYPVSELHGFSNFGKAALAVTAFLFLKSWTVYMSAAVECAGPAFGYVYFFILVIFGSFCLLNLTVATVSEAYSKVKKIAETKRKRLEEEQVERVRIESEREEMRRQAKSAENEDGESEEIKILFDTRAAYKLWLLGLFLACPCLHRFYLKTWYSGRWFLFRVATFNYGLIGWFIDGAFIPSLNQEASQQESVRRDTEVANLQSEKGRMEEQLFIPSWKRNITYAIAYPLETTAAHYTISYLEAKIKNLENNTDEQETAGNQIDDEQDISDLDSQSDCDESVKSEHANPSQIQKKRTESYFAWCSDFVVVINAISLALTGFNASLNPIISAIGFFATAYFIIESALKSVAYGSFSYYLLDHSNKFDFFLVLVPTVGELSCQATKALSFTNNREDFIYPMLVLRALRVLRILKLTRHLKGLQALASRAFGSPAGVFYAFLVTLVFIFTVALFGNELFKGSVAFASTRHDFEGILSAMKQLIEFLFGDNYFDSVQTGWDTVNFVGILFFVTYYYVANFLVLRIFIAIILENFEYTEEKKICIQIQLFQRHQLRSNDLIDGRARPMSFQENMDRLKKQDLNEEGLARDTAQWTKVLQQRAAEKGKSGGGNKPKMLWDVVIEAAEEPPKPVYPKTRPAIIEFLIGFQMLVRKVLYAVVENPRFNLFVAAMILASVALIIMDSPQDPIFDISTDTRQMIDYGLFFFFASEVGAKMFAYGVFTPSGVSPRTVQFPEGKPAFFSSSEEGGWNALDAVFIVVMLLDMPFIPISTGNFKVIRIVRVVRPVARNVPQVKTLLASLFSSFGSILHVMNLFFLLVLIFGLLGVQLFQGRLHYCNDLVAGSFDNCVSNVYGGLPQYPCFNTPIVTCPTAPLASISASDNISQGDSTQNETELLRILDDWDFLNYSNASIQNNESNFTEALPAMCSQNVGFFLGQAILAPRVWTTPNENFENFLRACMTLLRLFATDNMYAIYHSIMDIPSETNNICSDGSSADAGCPPGKSIYVVSSGPNQDNMPQNILFGMVFIFVGNAFISQLVIGVLIDNIRRQSGSALYTEAQRIWIATAVTLGRLSLSVKPSPPNWPPRKWMYEKLESPAYDNFLTVVVIFNIIWMTTEHEPREPSYLSLISPVENFFLGIYLLDLVSKMFAFGVFEYDREAKPVWNKAKFPFFRDPWNRFDFVIVLMALLDLSLPKVDLSFFKLLRVLRMFKLVSRVKVLKVMITTLLGAVPSILAALLFLGIWIFILAAIACDMMLFRNVRYGLLLDQHWNFLNLKQSMLLLFRTATGDGWFNLMYDTAVQPPFCSDFFLPVNEPWILSEFCSNSGDPLMLDPRCPLRSMIFTDTYHISDCGLGGVAWLYFAVFYLGSVFIFLPLFIATLIDYFTNPSVQVESLSIFNGDDCTDFSEAWKEFDPKSEGFISIENLHPFVDRLHARGHRTGFSVSADLTRFKKIWARIMTDPQNFPAEGYEVSGKHAKELGLSRIDRSTIVKAYGRSTRAEAIRAYLVSNCGFNKRIGKEVRFDYAAKVLCIHQNGIIQPLTMSDLVNLGSALQMFMGLVGKHEVQGDAGKENTKWQALNVHNQLEEELKVEGGGTTSDSGEERTSKKQSAAQIEDLPNILKAREILLKDLYPKPVPGHEWKVKPTPKGEKRDELLKKIKFMEEEFEKGVSRLIAQALWGNGEGNSTSVLDELLDGIFDAVAFKYAHEACTKVSKILQDAKGVKDQTKRYTQAFPSDGPREPVVSTVPRGWLNSRRLPSERKRVHPGPDARDNTGHTLSSLWRLGPSRPGAVPPPPPPRHDSLAAKPPSEALAKAMRSVRMEDTWRQCYVGATGTATNLPNATISGGWKSTYQEAIRQINGTLPRSSLQGEATEIVSSGRLQSPGLGAVFAACSGSRKVQ